MEIATDGLKKEDGGGWQSQSSHPQTVSVKIFRIGDLPTG
jgi:hypothetical protein